MWGAMENNINPQENEPNIANTPAPPPVKKKNKSAAGWIFCLLLVLGYKGYTSQNSGLAEYYNDFAQKSYNVTVIEKWNALLQVVQENEANLPHAALELKTKTIPALNETIDRAGKKVPPYSATEYHQQYGTSLEQYKGNLYELQTALENNDQPTVMTKLDSALQKINEIEKNLLAFRDKMIADGKITITTQPMK